MSNPPPRLGMYPYYDEIVSQSTGLKRLFFNLLPIPLHTFFPLRQEIYLALVRLRSPYERIRYSQRKELLVNIGAGSKGKRGWINVDMVKAPEINCVYDCRKELPFTTGSVRGIFCEHFFEHLDYTEEVPFFLNECHRVLKNGGVLRLILPDVGRYLQAYIEPGWDQLSDLRPLDEGHVDRDYRCQYRTKMELINMVFRQAYRHKYAYDFETLEFLLSRYAFSKVVLQEFNQTLMPELRIDSAERATESLYVEAVKQ
jgi:predicted SAM-dependent methyltransferase